MASITLQYDRDPGLDTIWYGRRLETVRITIAEDGSMSEAVEQWTGAPSSVNRYLRSPDAGKVDLTDAQREAIRQLAQWPHPAGYHLIKWLDGAEAARIAAAYHN